MLKIKDDKWKEFCKTAETFGFMRIGKDAYATDWETNDIRINKKGLCYITRKQQPDGIINLTEDYEFKSGYPKNVINLIEAGFVQFPELK